MFIRHNCVFILIISRLEISLVIGLWHPSCGSSCACSRQTSRRMLQRNFPSTFRATIFDQCHFTFSAHVALKGLLPEVLVLVLNQALFPGKSLHTDIALERTLTCCGKIYVGIREQINDLKFRLNCLLNHLYEP